MSDKGRLHTIRVPLRKICSVIPAVALISGGIIFSASAAPTPDIQVGNAASDSPVIEVPDVAMTLTPPARVLDDSSSLTGPADAPPAAAAPEPLAPIVPAGTLAGSSSLVTLDSTGIPVRALEAYRTAGALLGSADPACHLDWALVAAIGRVESNHARFGGNQLDSAGVAQPGIIGIPLNGSNGTARIIDSDNGALDRDTAYDRAVGPMQFIPSTWRVAGTDADRDGVKNPQDMTDAATASSIYLCSGPGDLRRPDDLRSAILRYNASDSYAQMVTAIADAYRHGVSALPASDLAPAKPAPPAAAAARAVPVPAAPAVPGAIVRVVPPPATRVPSTPVPSTPVPSTPSPSTPSPTTPDPTTPDPTKPVPATTDPTKPAPTTPVPCLPVPTTPAPSTTTPGAPGPTPTGSETPAPCLPEPCMPSTDPTAPAPANPCPTPTSTSVPSTPGPTA
jgi:membrane-bound lytic murein transglycosylase B